MHTRMHTPVVHHVPGHLDQLVPTIQQVHIVDDELVGVLGMDYEAKLTQQLPLVLDNRVAGCLVVLCSVVCAVVSKCVLQEASECQSP